MWEKGLERPSEKKEGVGKALRSAIPFVELLAL